MGGAEGRGEGGGGPGAAAAAHLRPSLPPNEYRAFPSLSSYQIAGEKTEKGKCCQKHALKLRDTLHFSVTDKKTEKGPETFG